MKASWHAIGVRSLADFKLCLIVNILFRLWTMLCTIYIEYLYEQCVSVASPRKWQCRPENRSHWLRLENG
jgi:hypothetical protein